MPLQSHKTHSFGIREQFPVTILYRFLAGRCQNDCQSIDDAVDCISGKQLLLNCE